MKQNTYEIEKNIDKIKNKSHTGFLTQNTIKELKRILKKEEYNELIPYNNAEKTILYTTNIPKISLFKINTKNELKHQSILGSLFALNITSEVFGDIIKYQNNFYIYLLDNIKDLIKNELTTIDKYKVELIEVPINTLNNYEKEYKEIELIVTSLRIDTIISRLIGTNRNNIDKYIKNKEIQLNYEPLKKKEYLIKEKDIFSIKKHGKYYFEKIIKRTKKDNYIILLKKYM